MLFSFVCAGEDGSGESSSDAGSDESEPELSMSSEDEEEECPPPDAPSSQQPSVQSVISSQQGLLVATKLCCDWLRGDNTTLLACARSSRSLLEQVVKLLNLVADTAARSAVGKEDLLKVADLVPLPEDIATRGIGVLSTAQQTIDWKYWRLKRLNSQDEVS